MDKIIMIFLLILKSSIMASITVLIIMLIKNLFRNKLSARMHYLLWILVLVRLMIPVLPESSLSLFNIVNTDFVEVNVEDTVLSYSIESDLNKDELLNEQSIDEGDSIGLSRHAVLKILSVIWLIGSGVMILLILRSLVEIKVKSGDFQRVTDERVLDIYKDCKDKMGIKSNIEILSGEYFVSPCILGFIKPYIYLPNNMVSNIDTEQLNHIILHELAHFKRMDYIGNLFKAIALSIHWFNPVIWFCIKDMHRDIEMACDAYVLEVLGEKEIISYGKTIIDCLKLFSVDGLKPNVLFFCQPKNTVERRIRMIKGFKKGSYKLSIVAVILLALVTAFMVTNGVTAQAPSPVEAEIPDQTSNFNDRVIVIDAGHGGEDKGAINGKLDMYEKDVVLDISLRLKQILESEGFKVYLTREDDSYVKLNDRTKIANSLGADVFIGIHTNAHQDFSISGVVAEYASIDDRDNKLLASLLNSAVAKQVELEDKGIMEFNKVIVLKDTKMPSTILELGFITNTDDAMRMKSDEYKQGCAIGIKNGLVNYFNNIK